MHSAAIRWVLIAAIFSGGCTGAGLAPQPVSDPDVDLEQLGKQYNQADSIDKFYASARTEADRDKFIAGRLVMTNIRYLQYVRKLTSDRQLINSASDVLALSLNLAGAATGGAAEKTVLAAIAAAVTGSKAVIDREYFYQKTMPVLVSAMNAERKVVLARILEGMRSNIGNYTFEKALSDLHDYEFSGSVIGASQAIQVDAGQKETIQNGAIAAIQTVPTFDEAVKGMRGRLTDSIGLLSDLTKANAAIKTLAPLQPATDGTPVSTIEEAKVQLQRKVREARKSEDLKKVEDAFKGAAISY